MMVKDQFETSLNPAEAYASGADKASSKGEMLSVMTGTDG